MIYLDYNASTPVDPAVREAMWPFLGEFFGNASSDHPLGRKVNEAVANARKQVADLLGAKPEEILLTSGGTESNNYVIKGVARKLRDRGQHIITSSIEHPAVVNPCKSLEGEGFETTYVPVDQYGLVDVQEVISAVRPDTILISIMHANNEVGTIQPIAELSEIAREGGIWMHTDSAQTCGKLSTDVNELGVDFLSIAGHKVYAPQGIGALYIRDGISLEPLHHGAGHESGRRAGTEAVPAIVGLGKAAELAKSHIGDTSTAVLRDRLWEGLSQQLGDNAVLLGHPTKRLPNTLAVGFRHRIGADILRACPELCASTGAACHAAHRKRSAVLAEMNVPQDVAFGAVRFSLGHPTTQEEIDQAIELIVKAVSQCPVA